jgi:hypothetical protein
MHVLSQNEKQDVKTVHGYSVPSEFLDTEYPQMRNTGNEVLDAEAFRKELRKYSKETGKFPRYISTGNPEADQASYLERVEEYFRKHPFFPQAIDTNNPEKDKENLELWIKAWMEYFPEKAKQVKQIIEEGGVK